jgi:bifunctional non-homologous end joining protein LigD
VPIAWDELTPKLRSDAFDLRNTPERLASLARDPWRDFDSARAAIGASVRRSVGMR